VRGGASDAGGEGDVMARGVRLRVGVERVRRGGGSAGGRREVLDALFHALDALRGGRIARGKGRGAIGGQCRDVARREGGLVPGGRWALVGRFLARFGRFQRARRTSATLSALLLAPGVA
jgi:hypothetical protein